MYTHGSLRSELKNILTFVDGSFHQIGQKPPFREPVFTATSLPCVTDSRIRADSARQATNIEATSSLIFDHDPNNCSDDDSDDAEPARQDGETSSRPTGEDTAAEELRGNGPSRDKPSQDIRYDFDGLGNSKADGESYNLTGDESNVLAVSNNSEHNPGMPISS